MFEVLQNLPNRPAAWKLWLILFPLGGHYRMPGDRLEMQIARLVTHDTSARNSLIEGIYLTPNENNPIGKLNGILALADQLDPLIVNMRKAVREKTLPDVIGLQLIDSADEKGVITGEEADKLRDFDNRIMDIINVDDFGFDDFSRTGN
jgi:acyl-CoA dehydrogenase